MFQALPLDTIDNFFQSMTNRWPIDGLVIDCFWWSIANRAFFKILIIDWSSICFRWSIGFRQSIGSFNRLIFSSIGYRLLIVDWLNLEYRLVICHRVARPTHLQSINPESGESCFCFLYPHWVPFKFFSCTHIEIFKSKFCDAVGSIPPEGRK